MQKQWYVLFIFFLHLAIKSSSQGFLVSSPKLEFDGRQLLISFDIISKNYDDQFCVWVEMEKANGETIRIKSLSGDVGDEIKTGRGKKIIWIPTDDSIFLNEVVMVEVKAERRVKSFNRGSALLMSAIIPGLGQTKISKGKPWWLGGVAAYGAVAGGLIVNNTSLKTYDSYKIEEDIIKRKDLYNQAQQLKNISSALIISGAAIWAANIIWVSLVPDNYLPPQHLKLSLEHSTGPYKGTTLLTLRYNF